MCLASIHLVAWPALGGGRSKPGARLCSTFLFTLCSPVAHLWDITPLERLSTWLVQTFCVPCAQGLPW